ncbi:MAG: hypothetical protein J6S96_04025 [Muribaculaceae bacterium]|nr:hypothetical protein [Muribaculaceae bacterium]
MCAKFDGTNLFIAANDGMGTEMCYWFKECMNNQLFTFFRVGERQVERNYSDINGIPNSSEITWLNSTGSDNIGPVAIQGYNDFVGGNHRWRKPNANGSLGPYTTIRTANCNSYSVDIDGQPLSLGVITYGEQICASVNNTLFDPLVEPQDSTATVLDSPLINEDIIYTIIGNSIAVDAKHTYLKDFTVRRYYGMQSMYNREDSVMTPGGAYPTFVEQANAKTFHKNNYPNFGCYIEHNANGWCQSSWLRPIDLGTHYAIDSISPIFTRSSDKCYHVIMDSFPVNCNDSVSWHGIYTWALPLINDDDLLVYSGIIDGKESLYIDTKRACNRIFNYSGANYLHSIDSIRNSDGASFLTLDNAVFITCNKPISFILYYEPNDENTTIEINPDINGDGVINVLDITGIIDIINEAEETPDLENEE